MERAVDTFPSGMLSGAAQARRDQFMAQSADEQWRLLWPEQAASSASERHVRLQRPLQKLVQENHRTLADFVASLLILDPSRRPSASAALVHPFLFEHFPD